MHQPPGLVLQYIPNLSKLSFSGGSAPQRRVPLVHCITSAVHSYPRSISTGGRRRLATGNGDGWRRRGWPSLFLLYNSDVREIYPLYYYPPLVLQYSLELLTHRMHAHHAFYGLRLPLFLPHFSLFSLRRYILTAVTQPLPLFS